MYVYIQTRQHKADNYRQHLINAKHMRKPLSTALSVGPDYHKQKRTELRCLS